MTSFEKELYPVVCQSSLSSKFIIFSCWKPLENAFEYFFAFFLNLQELLWGIHKLDTKKLGERQK